MTARPHTILKTLKRESNNQLCLALLLATEECISDGNTCKDCVWW